jgi:PAS domain-containing protein
MMRILKNYNCVFVTTILSALILATFIVLLNNVSQQNLDLAGIIEINRNTKGLILLELLMLMLMATIVYSSRKNQLEKRFLKSYGSLLEESSSNILGINAKGAIYYANNPALKSLGLKSSTEIVGETLNDFIMYYSLPQSGKREHDLFTQLQKQGFLSGDGMLKPKTGETVEIDFRARMISGDLERNRIYAFTFANNRERRNVERARIRENHLQ